MARTAAVVVAIVLGACSSTEFGAIDVDGVELPERRETKSTPVDGGGSPTDPEQVPIDLSPDASRPGSDGGAGGGGTDGGPAADGGPPKSTFCSAANLVMCVEFEGSANDQSTNQLAATVQNVTFAVGKVGQAAQLTSQSAIRFGYSPALSVTAATVEAWVKRTAGGRQTIFDDGGRFAMELDGDELKCAWNGDSEAEGTVPQGQWVHVACVFEGNGGDVRLYINGNEADANDGSVGTSATAGAAIGGSSPSGNPFVGAIDQLRVFRVARTTTEIKQAAQP